jgi:hypothetical protein
MGKPLTHSALIVACSCRSQVRRSLLPAVQIWHFGPKATSDGSDAADRGTWEALDGARPLCGDAPGTLCSLPERLCRHARFPQGFFTASPDWSRKGFLHTCWRLQGSRNPTLTVVDAVNVHLFHDESNLRALERESADCLPGVSMFATARLRALRVVLHGLGRHARPSHLVAAAAQEEGGGGDAASAAMLGGGGGGGGRGGAAADELLFLFGDFNFRLDQAAVVRRLCGERGLSAAAAHTTENGPLRLSAERGACSAAANAIRSILMPSGSAETAAVPAGGGADAAGGAASSPTTVAAAAATTTTTTTTTATPPPPPPPPPAAPPHGG